jgi:hypothetical protein
VLSGVRLARHYLPGMRARNWGRVVFVSSESGVQIPVEMIHFGMTKTAQIAVGCGGWISVSGRAWCETGWISTPRISCSTPEIATPGARSRTARATT